MAKTIYQYVSSSAGNVVRTDAITKLAGWTDVIASSHYGLLMIFSSSISTSQTSS